MNILGISFMTNIIFFIIIIILFNVISRERKSSKKLEEVEEAYKAGIQSIADNTDKILLNTFLIEIALDQINNAEKAELDKNFVTIDLNNILNINQKLYLLTSLCQQFNLHISKIFTTIKNISIYSNYQKDYLIIILEDNKVFLGGNDFNKLVEFRKAILDYKN